MINKFFVLLIILICLGCSSSAKKIISSEKSTDSKAVGKSISENIFSNQEEALAKHLAKIGAVMYGAYWCPYCSQQKKNIW